jgi:uncharacterized protein (TIGR02266 family)
MGQEKRVFRRFSVTLTAHCRLGNRYIRDAILDLSEGGMYLRTKEPAREGTPVRVALALPHRDGAHFCTLAGNVARLDRDAKGHVRGLGVSFDDETLAAHDRDLLATYLEATRS